MNSIFPVHSFDRNQSRWENHLTDYTPVEKIGDIWYKREDKFAPLGYHSINGSKLRQCIWLVNGWIKDKGIKGVISGSVIGSPQHPFISSICKHYSIGCLIVTGSKDYKKHKNMQLAEQAGAKFAVTNIGYAKALQSKCFQYQQKIPGHEVLETNITLDDRLNPPHRIEGFHHIGSIQTENLPDHIENIIIPCGSCNSVTSILYGIARKKPASLKNIILMGIGNNGSKNLKYIPHRLEIISRVIGQDLNAAFNYTFLPSGNPKAINVLHFNPNGEGYCSYEDWMPFDVEGVALHPRYEGKCLNYIKSYPDKFKKYWNENTLFWIVGNEPRFI
jgi:hypothetical protein